MSQGSVLKLANWKYNYNLGLTWSWNFSGKELYSRIKKSNLPYRSVCVCVSPPGSLLCFVFLSLGMRVRVEAAPICVHGHAGCHSLSLADLFDRVIQHSARIHGLSSDLHTEFVSLSLPL